MKRCRNHLWAIAALAACLSLDAHGLSPLKVTSPLDLIVGPSTRLLVVAPHPDDETLAVAGLMHRVITHGGTVHVIWMTSGDGFPEGIRLADGITHPTHQDYRHYGELREREARAAVQSLGIDRHSVSFLGFPDEGLCELASTYFSDKSGVYASPYTERVSPPVSERVVHGVRYLGADLRREFERLVVSFSPTVIAIPAPQDAHPDHCATHIFVREALDGFASRGGQRPRVLHYLIHHRQWPESTEAEAGSELRPPADSPPIAGRWTSLALNPEEVAAKQYALSIYRSQILAMARFMRSFGRNNELFLEDEPGSMPGCWCNGENVATAPHFLTLTDRPRRDVQ